jgi:ankyrin repeat protein
VKKQIVVLVVLALTVNCATVPRESSGMSAQTQALFGLMESGTPQEVQAAISKGADVNARGYEDWTPLMQACYFQNFKVIATLLMAGADVNARDSNNGHTVMMWAITHYETPDEIIVLLDAGADAKVKNKVGKTALDYAKENWRFEGTEAFRRLQEASK